MEGNLRVPDGKQVRHVTDDGFFGRGIYTTTDPRLAFAYAKDAIVFACLALPGRQYKATQKRDRGVPKKAGYDSHLGYVLRCVREVHSTDAGCRNESRRWRQGFAPTDGVPGVVPCAVDAPPLRATRDAVEGRYRSRRRK